MRHSSTFREVNTGIYEGQLLSSDQAAAIADTAAKHPAWTYATIQRGEVSDIVDPGLRTAEVLFEVDAEDVVRPLREMLRQATEPLARSMSPRIVAMSLGQIVRYYAGGFYKPHRDNVSLSDNGRAIAALCYMNENFEGGGLDFPELEFTYQPRAGAVVLFPATYLHCAQLVSSGVKVVLTAWYLNKIR